MNVTLEIKRNDTLESLGKSAVGIAASAALDYLHTHGLEYDVGDFATAFRRAMHERRPDALADAMFAIDRGRWATEKDTFVATMTRAGVEAAKEAAMKHQREARTLRTAVAYGNSKPGSRLAAVCFVNQW